MDENMEPTENSASHPTEGDGAGPAPDPSPSTSTPDTLEIQLPPPDHLVLQAIDEVQDSDVEYPPTLHPERVALLNLLEDLVNTHGIGDPALWYTVLPRWASKVRDDGM